MPDWKIAIAYWLCIFAGIVITHALFLYSQFYTESEGYMWRATGKIWGFLSLFFLVEWVIGAFFFHILSVPISYTFFPLWLLAIIIGIVAACAPTALEHAILPKKGVTVTHLEKPLTKILLKLNLALRHKFAWAIESRRQQDVYDCQHTNGWGLGLSSTDISRRIRMLYEITKVDIAEKRKDPSLLHYDFNRNSWEKFYLLVRHVGRKRLREYLRKPLDSPCRGWDGRERRKGLGSSKIDRDSSADLDPNRHRLYDDAAQMKRISGGLS